jgi:SAM-dependent methyltransferase
MMTGQESADWYRYWFDEDYLTLHAHRDASEARRFVDELWTSLELGPGAAALDTPCGAGRYCWALAEKGARVVGLDLSRLMLDQAEDFNLRCPIRPLFIQAEMRKIPLADSFQLVTSLFSGVGCFDHEDANLAAFSELARIVAPKGMLVLDFINPAYLREHFLTECRRETRRGDVLEWREYDDEDRRLKKRIQFRHGGIMRTVHESVRIYDRLELENLCDLRGLNVLDFWGDYDGSPLDYDSPRLILLAQK